MSNHQTLISTAEVTPDSHAAPERARAWRIVMHECCDDESRGSIGCNYVMESMRAAGWHVEYGADGPCDIELLSVHHCSDYPTAAAMPKKGKLRIIGGHAMAVNPRPLIPFADVVCIGEAETWILMALRILAEDFSSDALSGLRGTIVSSGWTEGNRTPTPNLEYPIPKNAPYLNRKAKGHAATWYLEMARGCPFSCHYCELGHTTRYRIQDTDWLLDQIDAIDRGVSNRISLFAPDEASHPGYGQVLERIHKRGLVTSFGSMRMEQIVRRKLPLKANMLVRVGMDGLTEQTRFRVARKQTDDYFVEYFTYMSERGHTNFKIFMIVGYPWETMSDLDEWIALMSRIGRIERRTNAHVRIKVTPLIPQPTTPLADANAHYDYDLIARLERFVDTWRPKRTPGWFFEQDGCVMSFRNWKRQCDLTRGDENILRRAA